MNSLKVSAQFAAYVWYTETKPGTATRDEAVRFARENWVPFLSCAHEGWGRLLIRVAQADAADGLSPSPGAAPPPATRKGARGCRAGWR
jgi:hypothetical protein